MACSHSPSKLMVIQAQILQIMMRISKRKFLNLSKKQYTLVNHLTSDLSVDRFPNRKLIKDITQVHFIRRLTLNTYFNDWEDSIYIKRSLRKILMTCFRVTQIEVLQKGYFVWLHFPFKPFRLVKFLKSFSCNMEILSPVQFEKYQTILFILLAETA